MSLFTTKVADAPEVPTLPDFESSNTPVDFEVFHIEVKFASSYKLNSNAEYVEPCLTYDKESSDRSNTTVEFL